MYKVITDNFLKVNLSHIDFKTCSLLIVYFLIEVHEVYMCSKNFSILVNIENISLYYIYISMSIMHYVRLNINKTYWFKGRLGINKEINGLSSQISIISKLIFTEVSI